MYEKKGKEVRVSLTFPFPSSSSPSEMMTTSASTSALPERVLAPLLRFKTFLFPFPAEDEEEEEEEGRDGSQGVREGIRLPKHSQSPEEEMARRREASVFTCCVCV